VDLKQLIACVDLVSLTSITGTDQDAFSQYLSQILLPFAANDE